MWHDTKAATTLQNGEKVPVLVLDKYIKSPISHSPDLVYSLTRLGLPCLKATEQVAPGIIAEFLDSAGDERFLAKAMRFQADLAQIEASQCLYQGIMAALGYSQNKLPFLELACRLPLRLLKSVTQGKISDEECLARQQALLLGTAGLLPSQCPIWHKENRLGDEWVNKLEKLWASSRQTAALSHDVWHLFKVRPRNRPARRLVAMSYLILRYKEKGILEEVVNMIKEAPVNQGHHRLEKGLIVISSGIRSQTLLGIRRAADIVVNVLLPFTFAWSKIRSQPELGRKALDLYRNYPKLVENAVERHMKNRLGISNNLVNSARRQQGLIHIYNTLCTQGGCNYCRLSQLKNKL